MQYVTTSDTYKGLLRTCTETLEQLCKWADSRKLTFNPGKTEAQYFGKRPGQDKPTVMMRGVRVRCKPEMRYLGVIIDDKLKWKAHIRQACEKAKKMTHQVRAACRMTWGLSRRTMKAIYEGAIQPGITYAAPIW